MLVRAMKAAVQAVGKTRIMMNLQDADCCRVDTMVDRMLLGNYRLAIRRDVGITLVSLS
jgi:hypothetical protein